MIKRVGDFTLRWGESLVWDERRSRLYFVDTLGHKLCWLEEGQDSPHVLDCEQMPSGVVLDEAGDLVVTGDDGLYRVDVDRNVWTLLSRYPQRLGGRCNDLCADLSGNLITGRLNIGPGEGSAWWCSTIGEWRLLDDDIANTNGPTVAELDGVMTLIIGDSWVPRYYRYDYEPATGTVGPRTVFADVAGFGPDGADGIPDGATLDSEGGLWCALPRSGCLVRFTTQGFDRRIDLPFPNPTDVTFGGANLDRLYVVAVNDGLYVLDGVGQGRLEPRFAG
ncbi:MAG: SMP-30/gluconolactonase/LRE family protein [Vicinamibacterales bacterium]